MGRQYTIGEETYSDLVGAKWLKAAGTALTVVETIHLDLGDGTQERYYTVELDGAAAVVGVWAFVARIQHDLTPSGSWHNTYHRLPSMAGVAIPDIYRERGPDCDQCGHVVYRKDTFICRHRGTGEWRQVGRNCLTALTGVNNALGLLEGLEKAEARLAKAAAKDGGLPKDDPHERRAGTYVPTLPFLAYVARQIRIDGAFTSKRQAEAELGAIPTGAAAWNALRSAAWNHSSGLDVKPEALPTPLDQQQAHVWLRWVRHELRTGDDTFLGELQSLLQNDQLAYRSVNYAAFVARAYDKAHAAPPPPPPTPVDHGYVGSVGERITLRVKVDKAIESRSFYGGTGYAMTAAGGERLMWWASAKAATLQEGDEVTITGTVDRHQVYEPRFGRDRTPYKQTVLTNCRVADEVRAVGA
jgi:hypothetical protein